MRPSASTSATTSSSAKLDQFCMDPDDGSLTVCDDLALWYPSRPVLMPTASVLPRREGVPAGLKAHGFRDLPLYEQLPLPAARGARATPRWPADLEPLINGIDARHAAILATVDGGEATSQLSFSCIHAWLPRRLAGGRSPSHGSGGGTCSRK